MIFLTQNSINKNLNNFGFEKNNNEQMHSLFNNYLENFLKNKFQQAMKKHNGKNQRGGSGAHGHTVLPSEYFGLNSGKYNASVTDINMNVTDTLIRPQILTNDPSGVIKSQAGGQIHFNISNNAFNNALNQIRNQLHDNVNVQQETRRELKQQFEQNMSEILRKAKKQNNNLNKQVLDIILQQKKYKNFQN